VICDFAEENWPSMDLVGDMLFATLRTNYESNVTPSQIRPRLPFSSSKTPEKLTRLFGRFLHYPRELRRVRNEFDLFHIVDHSYAHLVHELPAGRSVVTCHDLDTFRAVLDPAREPRSFPFRAMTGRILSGLKRAAHITCDTAATRDAIISHNLVSPGQLTIVHNGVHPALRPGGDPTDDAELTQLLHRAPGTTIELLHVGSTIARKRIDILLQVLAAVRQKLPDIRLLRVGGPFTSDQEDLARELGIRPHIDVLPRLEPHLVAAAYRRSAIVLQPSEAEGFGLPVIEAMACGTPVIASDIPALREIGDATIRFCPVGDVPAWTQSVLAALTKPPDRHALLAQARLFSWRKYAASMVEIYERILAR
jgi:glycosyltransferase involved in cell wall biosynthesis